METASCEKPAQIPVTLLSFLLSGGYVRMHERQFVRDYLERGTNAFLWILFISVTGFLFKRMAELVRVWILGSRIPGPSCSLFPGYSRILPDGVQLADYLAKLHEKHGPIVKVWLCPKQLLVSVKDTETIKDVLVMAKDKPPLVSGVFRSTFGKSSLFVPSFDKVKNRRESLAFHLNGTFLDNTSTIALKVVDFILKKDDPASDTGKFNCWRVSQRLAFYILGDTLFGDNFFTWPKASSYEEILVKIMQNANSWSSYQVPHIWRKEYWEYQYLYLKLKYLTIDIIQQHKGNDYLFNQLSGSSHVTATKTGKKDYMDPSFMVNDTIPGVFHTNEVYPHLISEEELSGNIMGMMMHGFFRTASLVSSVLTRLVLHPELQKQIYLEINEARKEGSRTISFDHQKMQLLMATIFESARLLPLGCLLQRCSLRKDLKLKNNTIIPAGAILTVPTQLVHMDHSIWESDAFQFNPQQFLSKSADWRKRHNMADNGFPKGKVDDGKCSEKCCFTFCGLNENASFLPFGFGSRACIGQKYVICVISALFACLLENYEIKLQPGSSETSLETRTLGLLPNPDVVFVERKSL